MADKTNTRIIAGALAALVIILVASYAILNSGGDAVQQPAGPAAPNFAVALTDPPQVPPGTTALVIYYSGVQVHRAGSSGNGGFVNLNASGSVNLMNLTNVTDTIAASAINTSTGFDLVRFNITSARITMGNSTYNVGVPGNSIMIKLDEVARNSSGVLIDLMPTVIQVYGPNQTAFLMIPSARAVAIGNLSDAGISTMIGGRMSMVAHIRDRLQEGIANISISNAQLSVNGNVTSISLTVTDTGNRSVTLRHVMVIGNMREIAGLRRLPNAGRGIDSVAVPPGVLGSELGGITEGENYLINSINSNAIASNVTQIGVAVGNELGTGLGAGGSLGGQIAEHMGGRFNLTLFNISLGSIASSSGKAAAVIGQSGLSPGQRMRMLESILNGRLNATIAEDTHMSNDSGAEFRQIVGESEAFQHDFHGSLNFFVSNTGMLSIPFTEASDLENSGYALTPGESAMFDFVGTEGIRIGRGMGQVAVVLIQNQTYDIGVSGDNLSYASANATAK